MQTISLFRFSLAYLYILPLGIGAIFLRREISYSLIAVCILFHDYDSPRHVHLGPRIFDNLSAMLCFTFVVFLIQRYRAADDGITPGGPEAMTAIRCASGWQPAASN